MLYVPLSLDSAQKFTVALGGIQFTLTVVWNELAEGWYITIERGASTISAGRRMTRGTLLFNDTELGAMTTTSLRGGRDDPGRYAWGDTHGLAWLTPTEASMIRGLA